MFVIWWLPVWLLTPLFTHIFTQDSASEVLVVIVVVQSVIGIAGAFIAGKQIFAIMRQTSRKALPKTVWHVFWSGKIQP
jgi:hypothetical protein